MNKIRANVQFGMYYIRKSFYLFLGNTLHFGLLHLVSGEAKRQTFYNALTSRLGKLDGETKSRLCVASL